MSESRRNNSNGIFDKLAALRSGIRRHTALVGIGWTVCAVAGFVLLTLAFDFGFWNLGIRLKPAYRMTASVLCSLSVLYVFWRWFVSPQRVSLSDDDLALRVERHNPDYQDRLISAVQFLQATRPVQGSRELIDATTDQASRSAEGADFSKLLDWGIAAKRAVAGTVAGGIIVALFVAVPEVMAAWFQRNVLFQEAKYPSAEPDKARFEIAVELGDTAPGTYRSIDPGTFGVLADHPLDLVVRVKSLVDGADLPKTVSLVAEDGITDLEAGPDGAYRTVLRPTGSYRFHVAGNTYESGDVRTDDLKVVVESPAGLTGWTLAAVPPSYTRMSPRYYNHTVRGGIRVPSSGLLVFNGTATHPLTEARLTLRRKPSTGAAAVDEAPRLAAAVVKRTPEFETEIAVEDPGEVLLSVSMIDVRGYKSENVVSNLPITVDPPDEKPKVELAHPGTGDKVTAQVQMRLELRAVDDFGFLVTDASGKPGTYLQFRLRGLAGDVDTPTLENVGGLTHRVEIPGLPDLGGRNELPPAGDNRYPNGRFRWVWSPIESAKFTPGDKLEIAAVARDSYRRPAAEELFRLGGWAATAEIQSGRPIAECASPIVRVTVVEPAELLEILVSRQREQYKVLRRALERQENIITDVSRWIDDARRPTNKVEDLIGRLRAPARDQQSLAPVLAKSADVLETVHAEMECNRLGKKEDRIRLGDRVVLPLRGLGAGVFRAREQTALDPWLDAPDRDRLVKTVFPELEKVMGRGSLIVEISDQLEDLATRTRTREELVAETYKVYERQKLAAKLIKDAMDQMQYGIHSSLDEIVRLFRERVIKAHEDVLKETERKLKEQIESSVFDK